MPLISAIVILTITAFTDVALSDPDNDGKAEIVLLSENSDSLFDANSFEFEQSLSSGGSAMNMYDLVFNSHEWTSRESGEP